MALLVCWASGLLEVQMNKDVPLDGGPVVIASGTAGKLRQQMTSHGVYVADKGWYVPGCYDVPTEGREDGAVQHDRMSLVIAFNKRLQKATAKAKGLKHLKALG